VPEPSHIVLALGSGGTAAGLLAGIRLSGLRSRLLCVVVSDAIRVQARPVARLAHRTLRLLAAHGVALPPAPAAGTLKLERGWLGPGYGRSTPESEQAMELLEREQVMLDPVYTAKAVAALLGLNARGAFGEGPVLYWHTYSAPKPDPVAPGRGVEAELPDPVAPGRGAEEAIGR
jgi:D-cysteine desulfhydrase